MSIPEVLNNVKRIVTVLTSEQVRAGRMLLRWDQKDLARASKVSLPTIKRLEGQPGPIRANPVTIAAIERAFIDAGIEFIGENGDGLGVRQGKRQNHPKA